MQAQTTESATSAAWRTVTGMGTGFVEMLPPLAAGLVVFLVFWAIAAGTRRGVQSVARRRLEFPGAVTAFVSPMSPSCCSACWWRSPWPFRR